MFYVCSMQAEAVQLDQMREVAFHLGMSLGQAALAEDDLDRKLTLADAYQRAFASVRLSIALKMRLDRDARLSRRVEREGPETERLDVERPEAAEQPERPQPPERAERYDERDRDREAERVSFPILLRTLSRVADDAQTLLPQAAELPALRELLVRVKARPDPATPPPGSTPAPLRSRLSGGAATLTLAPPPRRGGFSTVPPRPSTGPPRR